MAITKVSAGLLMYRFNHGELQMLLVHPGGPFFQKKDAGAWSIPKGEVGPEEELLETAKREFHEEIGAVTAGPLIALTPIKQKGGKTVHAWAFAGDCDATAIVCNTCSIEWPPHSGRQLVFPEIDRAEFFNVSVAKQKINPAQVPFIDELEKSIHLRPEGLGAATPTLRRSHAEAQPPLTVPTGLPTCVHPNAPNP
jgi:predicted NUDIX family NTP pyrophosphohydrolase